MIYLIHRDPLECAAICDDDLLDETCRACPRTTRERQIILACLNERQRRFGVAQHRRAHVVTRDGDFIDLSACRSVQQRHRYLLRCRWRDVRPRPRWTNSSPPPWHLFGDRATITGHEDNPYEIVRICANGSLIWRGTKSMGYIVGGQSLP